MEKPNNIMPDPGIEPRTSWSVVVLATTRPTKQFLENKRSFRQIMQYLINQQLLNITSQKTPQNEAFGSEDQLSYT